MVKKFNYNPNDIFKFFYDLGYKSFTAGNIKLKKFNNMNNKTKRN